MALFWRIKCFLWKEQWRVCGLYYGKIEFFVVDFVLSVVYWIMNPYRICRHRGEMYGETPLTTLHKIAEKCALSAQDVWVELGAGRGRGCFWVAYFVGCRVQGVETIALFLRIAKWLARRVHCPHLSFRENADFSQATVVYCYGTTWSEETLHAFAEEMRALPSGARLISISAPFPEDWFSAPIEIPVVFPWGETTAYIQRRVPLIHSDALKNGRRL